MRFSRKFANSFGKLFGRGFAGNSGGLYAILKSYYQYVITGKSTEIIAGESDDWYYNNYGTGDVPVKINDTMVLTLDGTSYIESSKVYHGGDLDLTFRGKITSNSNNTTIFTDRLSNVYSFFFFLSSASTDLNFYGISDTGFFSFAITFPSLINKEIEINLKINTSTKTITVSYYNITDEVTYQNSTTYTGTLLDTSHYLYLLGSPSLAKLNGQIYSAIESNNVKYYCQDSQGVIIKDQSGNGNDGALIGANQAIAWGTRSDAAYPALQEYGHSDYLVNTGAGTAAHLADPSGENLSENNLTNGDFSDGLTNWGELNCTAIDNVGYARVTTVDDDGRFYQSPAVSPNEYYKLTFKARSISGNKILNPTTFNNTTLDKSWAAIQLTTEWKTYTVIMLPTDALTNWFAFRLGGEGVCDVDNVVIQSATAISLLDTYNFKLQPTISDIYYLDSTLTASGNGYMIRTTPTAITLFRVDAGTPTQLDTALITYTDFDNITPLFSATGATVYIDGIEVLISADTTYSTFKLFVVDNDAADQISHMSKDGIRYDPYNFANGTGTYKVRNSIGVTTLLDADGNELEIPPNAGFSNSGNTLLMPDNATINSVLDSYATLGVLKNPNVITFDILNGIDFTGIPETACKYTKENGVIKNLVIAKQ